MRYRKLCILMFLGILRIPFSLDAQQFGLQNVPNRITGTYILDTELVIPATFTVRHRGAASEYFATFSAGSSGSFENRQATGAGGVLSYQIYDSTANRNILKDLSANPSSQEVLMGSFPDDSGWTTQEQSFVVVLPPGQFPPAGTYTDTVSLTLYRGNLGAYTQVARRSVQIRITMPSVMELSVVPPGFPFNASSTAATLSFGMVEVGKSLAVDVLVRSNNLYSLTLLSPTGSALRINDPTDTSEVPFRITLNGNPVSIQPAQAYAIATGAGPTLYEGNRYSFVFTIDPFDFPTAGDYSATLTFTLVAQ